MNTGRQEAEQQNNKPTMTRILTISSGRGGVGKTLISVNLAVEAARRGLKVCLFDADSGPAGVNSFLGLRPERTLVDVIEARCRLRDILLHTDSGLDIIPGGSGVDVMANLPAARLKRLESEFELLDDYDLVVLDTAAGDRRGLTSLIQASREVLLVITPEPASLTDAYGLVKLLHAHDFQGRIDVIVNHARTRTQAEQACARFQEVARVYLSRSLTLAGMIPDDNRSRDAIRQQQALITLYPDSPAAERLRELADTLLLSESAVQESSREFWERYCRALPVEAAAESAATSMPQTAEPPPATTGSEGLVGQLATQVEHLSRQLAALQARLDASPAETVLPPPAPEKPVAGKLHRESAATSASRPEGRAGSVRQDVRPSAIDGLQLRRILGRLLIKAIDVGEEVQRLETQTTCLPADNRLRLMPGCYSVVTLRLEQLVHPLQFVEDVFHTCDIVGCEIRNLGSDEHCWLTDDRDGCVALYTDPDAVTRIQTYMPAGENAVEDDVLGSEGGPGVRESRPRLYRAPDSKTSAWRAVRERYKSRLVREDALSNGDMAVYRLIRYGKSPLFCGVFQPSDGLGDGEQDQAHTLG